MLGLKQKSEQNKGLTSKLVSFRQIGNSPSSEANRPCYTTNDPQSDILKGI